MNHKARRIVNSVTASFLLSWTCLTAWSAYAQSSQDVINERQSARIEQAAARVDNLSDRVRNIEAIKPDVIVTRLNALEEKFSDQQKLLWGIIVAVVVNLLTGNGRFPRRREREPSDMEIMG